jgi:hypothetical protein
LLGHWKNYDELEESLTIEELILTVESMRDKEHRHHKFLAAMQGVDLDEETVTRDITSLNGSAAEKVGFGIDQGLGYEKVGG